MSKLVKIKFVTGLVRFAHVHLYKPISLIKDIDPKYTLTIIISKSETAEIKRIKATYKEVIKSNDEFFALHPLIKKYSNLKDGDRKEGNPALKDSYYLSASSIEMPGVVDLELSPIIDANEIYDGCYGRVSITFYPYATSAGGGIAIALNNVQKLRDGKRIKGFNIDSDFV